MTIRDPRPAPAEEIELPCREPFDGDSLVAFLAARAVPGVEQVAGSTYRRALRLEHAAGVVALTPGHAGVRCELRLDDARDLPAAVTGCRRLLDMDADPEPIDARLAGSGPLAPLVRRRPGMRVPGTVDGFELAVRAIVGQQVSVSAARTVLGRLAAVHGERLAEDVPAPTSAAPRPAIRRQFPSAAALAHIDPERLPFPRTRARALVEVARLAAGGELALDAGADPDEARSRLLAVPGIGPWTAGYVAMRALGDPDVFLPGDAGVRHALARLGGAADDGAWRPWRSYAVMHLWRSLDG